VAFNGYFSPVKTRIIRLQAMCASAPTAENSPTVKLFLPPKLPKKGFCGRETPLLRAWFRWQPGIV
jgi:hypothetical protein